MTGPDTWDQGTDRASSAVLLMIAGAVLGASSVVTRTRDAWRGLCDRTRATFRGCPCGARYECRFPACGEGEGRP